MSTTKHNPATSPSYWRKGKDPVGETTNNRVTATKEIIIMKAKDAKV